MDSGDELTPSFLCTHLQQKFQQWNATCSELYAGPQASAAPTSASSGRSTTGTSTTSGASHPWTFHLWDDTENRQLIQHYFPFFLATYDAFPENIFRADAARYAYMYLFGRAFIEQCHSGMAVCANTYYFACPTVNAYVAYLYLNTYHAYLYFHTDFALNVIPTNHTLTGGMYVDLDTECMASMEPYFSARRAPGVYLAAMATIDKDRHHSVPNAWMASSPGHPFWLLMMANIMGFHASGGYERQGIAGRWAMVRNACDRHNSLQSL